MKCIHKRATRMQLVHNIGEVGNKIEPVQPNGVAE